MTPNQLPPLPEPHIGLPWRCNAKDGSIHSSAFTWAQMHAYALAAIAQQAQEPSHVAALTAIASGDLGGLRYLESNEAAIERMKFIARSALKTESSEKENTCTNGTQSILPSQQSAEKRAATATLADGFQGHQGRAAPMQAGQSQGEPFAHIVVINTADAGPTKFFTAPSDPRGIAVYTTPPAPQPAPVDERIEEAFPPPTPIDSEELDAWVCDHCNGGGWHWQEHQVGERKTDVQQLKTHCDKCEGLGYCGPDAEARAALQSTAPQAEGGEA